MSTNELSFAIIDPTTIDMDWVAPDCPICLESPVGAGDVLGAGTGLTVVALSKAEDGRHIISLLCRDCQWRNAPGLYMVAGTRAAAEWMTLPTRPKRRANAVVTGEGYYYGDGEPF